MGTGKKKTSIKKIENRRVTFTKRRQGLFNKMDVLEQLTECRSAAIVLSAAGRPYDHGDLSLLDQFAGRVSSGESSLSCNSHGEHDDYQVFDDLKLEGLGEVPEDASLYQMMVELERLKATRQKVAERLSQVEADGVGNQFASLKPMRIFPAKQEPFF